MALNRIAQAMGMSDAVWRRHANPWSVWTRFPCLPLMVLAIWSWGWIGWAAMAPITATVAWTYLNPRVFSEPPHFDSWASYGVMGERIHIYRPHEVASHHATPLRFLTWAPLFGVVPLIYGLAVRDPVVTALGTVLTMILKVWFVDRMAWIAREWRDDGHTWDELDGISQNNA